MDIKTIVGYVSLGLSILLGIFVLIAVISALGKRLAKNVLNAIAMVCAFVAMTIVMPMILNFALEIEVVKGFLDSTVTSAIASVPIDLSSSEALVTALIKMLASAVLTPIVFIVCLIAVKIVLSILLLFIPPLRRLTKKQVVIDGKKQKVRLNPLARLISLVIGAAVGFGCYFIVLTPVTSLVDMATTICAGIPDELLETNGGEPTAQTNDFSSFAVVYEEGNEGGGSKSNPLESVLEYVKIAKDVSNELDNCIAIKAYKMSGVNKITNDYLNKASATTYEIDGEQFTTNIASELTNTVKGAVTVASYYALVSNNDGSLNIEQMITSGKIDLENGLYFILSNNSIMGLLQEGVNMGLDMAFPAEGGGDLQISPEDLTALKSSFNFKAFAKESDEVKKNEAKAYVKLVKDVINSIGDIIESGTQDLDKLMDFMGKVLDDINVTKTLGGVPPIMLRVVAKSDLTQGMITTEMVEELNTGIANGTTTYTKFFNNVKSILAVAQSFTAEPDPSLTPEQQKEQQKQQFENAFEMIYENQDETVKSVMTEAVGGLVKSLGDEGGLVATFVDSYFTELFEYAGADGTSKEDFKAEADNLMAMMDVVSAATSGSGDGVSVETVETLVETLDNSPVLTSALTSVAENPTAKEQFAELIEGNEAAVEEQLDKMEGVSQDTMDLIKNLLGLSK